MIELVESFSVSLRPFEREADIGRVSDGLARPRPLEPLDVASPFARGFDGMRGHAMITNVPSLEMAAPGALAPGGGPIHLGPSLADQVSFLSGIDDAGQVVAQSFWTWNGNVPATYAGTSGGSKWGANHATDGEVATVNYFFEHAAHWNATEKGVWKSCLSLWSAITNVEFVKVGERSAAHLILKRGDDGSAYQFDASVSGGEDAGEIGGTELWVKEKAVISIDTSVPGFGPIDGDFTAFGGYVWGTVIHELGHALGLGHAGPYNGFVNPNTQQFSAYDTLLWSIMSYLDPDDPAKYDDEYPVIADWGTSPDGYGNTATTWMPLDILAVQQLYGTPLTTPLSGGQTFGFNCDVGGNLQRFFDFTVNVNPVITLWSAGVDNTLDLSGFRRPSTIDLNPGSFTSCDDKIANIMIAFDTVFETAIGGRGNDVFTANDLGNTLVGNKGNDTFHLGGGADHVTGGIGSDVIVCADAGDSTGVAFDTVQGFNFAAVDSFDVFVDVSDVDTTVDGGTLSDADFDNELAAAIGAGELAAGNAVLFKPDAGQYAGERFLVIDTNDDAGYQAGEDLVFLLENAKNLGALDGADFI